MASPLPFPKDTFDLIVSDSTFEHVSEATRIAYELDRVVNCGHLLRLLVLWPEVTNSSDEISAYH